MVLRRVQSMRLLRYSEQFKREDNIPGNYATKFIHSSDLEARAQH